ncbi:hypothetical protein LTR64_001138 [Lithohypha guttulata]|uniref:uncharacterized protein n=1 Tax=Lithohypha guttulata TaxID=1690604 RepID=UPI002DDF20ED|nr:hypothetical protein LTR51_003332 [Lithohypha guttulata]
MGFHGPILPKSRIQPHSQAHADTLLKGHRQARVTEFQTFVVTGVGLVIGPPQIHHHNVHIIDKDMLGHILNVHTTSPVLAWSSAEKLFLKSSATVRIMIFAKPLRVHELEDAVTLSTWMLLQQFPSTIPPSSPEDNSTWLRYFELLLKTNVEGQVSFKQHAMAFFLQRFRIEGIDTSHRTIALLCNELNELEGFVPDTGINGQPVSQRTTSSFATYASKHSQYHYHIASKSSLCLRTDSSWKDISTIRRPSFLVPNPTSRAEDESDFEVIEKDFRQLKIDAESQDWIFVDSA